MLYKSCTSQYHIYISSCKCKSKIASVMIVYSGDCPDSWSGDDALHDDPLGQRRVLFIRDYHPLRPALRNTVYDQIFLDAAIIFTYIRPTCRGTCGGKTCPCSPTWRSRQSLRCPATLPVGGGRKSASHLSESRSNLGYAKLVVYDRMTDNATSAALSHLIRTLCQVPSCK